MASRRLDLWLWLSTARPAPARDGDVPGVHGVVRPARIIEFRYLMGEPRENDLIDLAALELAFAFPGLILHTVLRETRRRRASSQRSQCHGWRIALAGLYATGAGDGHLLPVGYLQVIPAPRELGPYIGISIGALFTVISVLCLC